MRSAILLFTLFAAATVSFAQSNKRSSITPDQLALRDRLESMSSIIQLKCGLTLPILPGEIYEADARKQQADNSKYRLEFYKAAKSGRPAKLSYTCTTDEGTIARDYLLAAEGKITRIADFSRDYFGGNSFIVWECSDLSLGHFVVKPNKEIVYQTLNETDIKNKVLVLSCQTPEGRATGARLTF